MTDPNGTLGAVNGDQWGGFHQYENKNYTVIVTNIGQDNLNLAWSVSGLDSSVWSLTTYWGDSLNQTTNLFPATDLATLNASGTSETTGVSGQWFSTTMPACTTTLTVNFYFTSTYVPTINDLNVTVAPQDNLNGHTFWVSNLATWSFTINLNSPDSVAHTFNWKITLNQNLQSYSFTAYPQAVAAPSQPFTILLAPQQSVYVCFVLEKTALSISTAEFQLQLVSLV